MAQGGMRRACRGLWGSMGWLREQVAMKQATPPAWA